MKLLTKTLTVRWLVWLIREAGITRPPRERFIDWANRQVAEQGKNADVAGWLLELSDCSLCVTWWVSLPVAGRQALAVNGINFAIHETLAKVDG